MNDHRLRFNRVICFYTSVLALVVGLVSPAYSATYDGYFSRIVTQSVGASAITTTGTAIFTGANLVPKTFNLPVIFSSNRLATLAKGSLRFSGYGLAIHAAMTAADWFWDSTLKNWTKSLTCLTQANGNCKVHDCDTPVGSVALWRPVSSQPFKYYLKSDIQCLTYTPPDALVCGLSKWCSPQVAGIDRHQLTLLPGNTFVRPASDQDIFDDGVKQTPNPIQIILSDLPNAINTPLSVLEKPGNPINIQLPPVVTSLRDKAKDLDNDTQVQDAIEKAVKEGPQSLTPEETQTLTDNNVDLTNLINAINKLSQPNPNLPENQLTPQEQAAVDTVNNIQNNVTNNLVSNTVAPTGSTEVPDIKVDIPTDCDLIPFVCNWLTWYKSWLDSDKPVEPEEDGLPTEELTDFNPSGGSAGSCPVPHQISVFSRNYEISYQPFCDLALLLNPLVLAMAWLISGYIVTRSR